MRYRKMLINAVSPQDARDYWLAFTETKRIYTTLEEGINRYSSAMVTEILEDVIRYKKSMNEV